MRARRRVPNFERRGRLNGCGSAGPGVGLRRFRRVEWCSSPHTHRKSRKRIVRLFARQVALTEGGTGMLPRPCHLFFASGRAGQPCAIECLTSSAYQDMRGRFPAGRKDTSEPQTLFNSYAAPEGRLRIAQHASAGIGGAPTGCSVPEGRLNVRAMVHSSLRDWGASRTSVSQR